MEPDVTKWMKAAEYVNRAGFSPCIRDGNACKSKWNQILPDYKRILDYHYCSGRNTRDFWDLTSDQWKEEGLPKQFNQEFYMVIHEWICERPQVNPLHLREVLSPHDSNFLPDVPTTQRQGCPRHVTSGRQDVRTNG